MMFDNQHPFFQSSGVDADDSKRPITQYVSDAFSHANDIFWDTEKLKSFLHDWYLDLIPTLCVMGIGSVLVPHFALGLAVGVLDYIVKTLIVLFLEHVVGHEFTEISQKYHDHITKNRFDLTLWGPILEELMFRFALQVLLPLMIFATFAPSFIPFLFAGLNVVTACCILITSIMFGLVHLGTSENHDNYEHAISATMGGIVYGVLAVSFITPLAPFDIAAPIAAHIAYNTLCCIHRILYGLFNAQDHAESEAHQNEQDKSLDLDAITPETCCV